jgi:hypothetical protein
MPTATFKQLHMIEMSLTKTLAKLPERGDQIKVLNAVLALHGLAVVEKAS